MKKIITSLILIFCLLISLATPAFAVNNNGNVTIAPQAQSIPQEIVDDIVRSHPNEAITIYNWVKSAPTMTPRIVFPGIITKTTTATKALESDRFVISVAKGSTKKLITTWKASLSASCSDITVKPSLNLGATIERTYTKEVTFNGPPESSSYNSREYRVKFYENRGTYKVTNRTTDMGQKLPDLSGNWTSPHSYVEYSVDSRV